MRFLAFQRDSKTSTKQETEREKEKERVKDREGFVIEKLIFELTVDCHSIRLYMIRSSRERESISSARTV